MTFKGPIPTQAILRFYENLEDFMDFWLHVSLYRKQHDLPGRVIRASCFLQQILEFFGGTALLASSYEKFYLPMSVLEG